MVWRFRVPKSSFPNNYEATFRNCSFFLLFLTNTSRKQTKKTPDIYCVGFNKKKVLFFYASQIDRIVYSNKNNNRRIKKLQRGKILFTFFSFCINIKRFCLDFTSEMEEPTNRETRNNKRWKSILRLFNFLFMFC